MNEDLDTLGDNEECDEELQGGESSTQKKNKSESKNRFSWAMEK